MRRLTGFVLALPLLAVPAQALAVNTWCYTNHPNAIYCEDFDRYCCADNNTYCTDTPPWPERCNPALYNDADIRDFWAFWNVWSSVHNCGWIPAVHDEGYSSYPYSARIGCHGWGNQLGYSATGLADDIRNKFGTAYTRVLGTDLTPLIAEVTMHGGWGMHSANLYLELGLGRGSGISDGVDSLTNWIISPNCSLCGFSGDQSYYPIICRQSPRPSGCADASTAPVLPVVAAGFLAFLDRDPCHCSGSQHWPQTDRLAFFDGRVWRTLRKGDFPDPGGSEPAPGDFALNAGNYFHRIKLTIKSTSVIVELRVAGVLSRCEVPRVYTGSFNSMIMGYQTPCQLVPGTWNCNGAEDCSGPCGPGLACCVSGTYGGATVAVDDIVLHGGQGYAERGACCFPDTTCVEAYPGDCLILGGQAGPGGSTCQTHACCPPLPPDHDMDGDVDLADFGWFQTCLAGHAVPPPTVACRCADYQGDGFVDALDLVTFLGCMRGPEIPAEPNCID